MERSRPIWLLVRRHPRMVTQLYPEAFQLLTLDQLRSGPLGQVRESKERVLEAIDSALQLLFWPAATDD